MTRLRTLRLYWSVCYQSLCHSCDDIMLYCREERAHWRKCAWAFLSITHDQTMLIFCLIAQAVRMTRILLQLCGLPQQVNLICYKYAINFTYLLLLLLVCLFVLVLIPKQLSASYPIPVSLLTSWMASTGREIPNWPGVSKTRYWIVKYRHSVDQKMYVYSAYFWCRSCPKFSLGWGWGI